MCQNPNQYNAKPCSKPRSAAGPNNVSKELFFYSHNSRLDSLDECQVKAGVPTGWIVKEQVCENGEWVDVEVTAPQGGIGTAECPAIFDCQTYPDYCQEEDNLKLKEELQKIEPQSGWQKTKEFFKAILSIFDFRT